MTPTRTLTAADVTVAPCECGRLVRLAYRSYDECRRCGEPIATGAVGVIDGDDCRPGRPWPESRHGTAEAWHECGRCGWHNLPTQITEYLADHHDDLGEAVDAGLRRLAEALNEER